MKRRTFAFGAIGAAATLAVTGCGTRSRSKFRSYHGPEVTSVVVNKGARNLYLLHHEEILEAFKIDLGFAPVGDKQFEGDGRTPEGTYLIDRRNPNSAFHLSLGISYPSAADVAEAWAMGKKPGGEIFVHGEPNLYKPKRPDWTAGCIAVKNPEIEQIYAMVRTGTPISLRA